MKFSIFRVFAAVWIIYALFAAFVYFTVIETATHPIREAIPTFWLMLLGGFLAAVTLTSIVAVTFMRYAMFKKANKSGKLRSKRYICMAWIIFVLLYLCTYFYSGIYYPEIQSHVGSFVLYFIGPAVVILSIVVLTIEAYIRSRQ
jgi:hypothetical protein